MDTKVFYVFSYTCTGTCPAQKCGDSGRIFTFWGTNTRTHAPFGGIIYGQTRERSKIKWLFSEGSNRNNKIEALRKL